MPIRQPIAVVSSLLLGFALAAPSAAQADSVSPFALTPGRLAASLAALIGLIGVAAGGLALARVRRAGNAPRTGTLALLAGLISVGVGGVVVASAKGGLGTGHGLGGGVVALVAGSISVVLAGLTRTRTRRVD
jgi:hypothetical protein